MCLEFITEEIDPDISNSVISAWKVFRLGGVRNNHHLRSESVISNKKYVEEVWYKAEQHLLHCEDSNEIYMSGFHAYADKNAAKMHILPYKNYSNLVIREVVLKRVFVKGMQLVLFHNCPCFVAEEMMILPMNKPTKSN